MGKHFLTIAWTRPVFSVWVDRLERFDEFGATWVPRNGYSFTVIAVSTCTTSIYFELFFYIEKGILFPMMLLKDTIFCSIFVYRSNLHKIRRIHVKKGTDQYFTGENNKGVYSANQT